jgi:hypothetical protein
MVSKIRNDIGIRQGAARGFWHENGCTITPCTHGMNQTGPRNQCSVVMLTTVPTRCAGRQSQHAVRTAWVACIQCNRQYNNLKNTTVQYNNGWW